MARLKLKLRVKETPESAPEPASRQPKTERRALRRPAKGMPEKRGFVGNGNALSIPGYPGKGEPSQYNPAYIDLMRQFFERDPWEIVTDSKGVPRMIPKDKLPTVTRFARTIGFSTQTLVGWASRFPEFGAIYEECKEMQKTFIMESGGLTLNGGFAAFMLRCNHGMREPVDPSKDKDDITTQLAELIGKMPS